MVMEGTHVRKVVGSNPSAVYCIYVFETIKINEDEAGEADFET